MRAAARAKINWTLDITGVDGPWHMLDMLMDRAALCDWIELEDDPAGRVRADDIADVENVQDNLVCRAANLLREETGCGRGVFMRVEKHIPSGAGLAGGSADAAAVFLALNEMWGLHLPLEKLCELSLKIGSDIPYCLVGGRRRAEGRGEVLSPAGGSRRYHLVLAKGEQSLATGRVFQKFDEIGRVLHPDTTRIAAALENGRMDELSELLPAANVLQEAACSLCPEVAQTLEALWSVGTRAAFMTGSGAACVGLFDNENEALAADAALEGRVAWHCATHTVSIV